MRGLSAYMLVAGDNEGGVPTEAEQAVDIAEKIVKIECLVTEMTCLCAKEVIQHIKVAPDGERHETIDDQYNK